MERVTDQCIEILDSQLSQIRKLLQLEYEVGGTITLSDKYFQVTLKGDLDHPSIYNAEIHPFLSEHKVIDWHTHYNTIPNIDGLPLDAPRVIPSDTDILTLIKGSVWHKHPCISIVISQWGYFFMTVPTRMIQCLSQYSPEEVENICSNGIREKISKGAYRFFYDHSKNPLHDRVDQYIEYVKNIYEKTNKTYGLYCRMVFRDLTPRHPTCVIQ
jgi:hypothetical protein